MISILIPTYNYACLTLVKVLQKQGEQLCQTQGTTKFRYEILVADDCSTQLDSIKENLEINQMANCSYTILPQNVGRAAIRNRLAAKAAYDYLLFIDSDAQVCSDHFLADYWEIVAPKNGQQQGFASEIPAVVCGGLRNVSLCPGASYTLRFIYESEADKRRNAAERSKRPYNQFTTFNFLVSREIFCSIGFNEQCRHYGYEDFYFGIELQKRGISIRHIDNPLVHAGIDTNQDFLKKSETALKTLYSLEEEVKNQAHIARAALKLERFHLLRPIAYLFPLFRPLLRQNLLGAHPNLQLFKLYKLGYYASISRKASE